MTDQDYELLSQYLDGELAATAMQEMRKRLMAEPELRACLARLQTVNSTVQEAFDIPGADTVPAQIVHAVKHAPTQPTKMPAHHRAGWGLAVAASLVAAAGLLLTPEWRQQAPEQSAGGDALLAHVLEHSTSRGDGWDALEDGRQVRPLLSFRSTQGDWCREYLVAAQSSTWRGVACRGQGQWITAVLTTEATADSAIEYRPAGSAASEDIASFIDTNAADIALSLDEEAALITSNWQ